MNDSMMINFCAASTSITRQPEGPKRTYGESPAEFASIGDDERVLQLMSWAGRFLRGVDVDDLARGADDDCAAMRRARMMDASLSPTLAVLESHPEGRKVLNAQIARKTPGGAALAADRGLRLSFAIVIEAARQTLPLESTHKLDHVHLTFSDIDDPFAFSDSFADGSGLLRVSTSLLSACNQVAMTNDWASRIRNRGEREALEHFWVATTALRYYQLHQMVFGNSGKVHPAKALGVSSEALLLPSMFVMAHELAHHLLEHSRATGGQELEFQADLFALRLLEDITTGRFARDALAGASVALLAIELDRSGRFVRIPSSHPSFRQRWERLTSARPDRVRLPLATRLIDMVETAARTRTPLPQEAWRDFRVSRDWDLSYHGPEYFVLMEGFDRVHGFTADTVRDLLSESPKLVAAGSKAFLQGLDAVEHVDIADALSSWSLEGADEVLDPNQPLEFHTLLEDIRTSTLWGRRVENTDLAARMIALLCTSRLLIAIAGVGIPAQTRETR